MWTKRIAASARITAMTLDAAGQFAGRLPGNYNSGRKIGKSGKATRQRREIMNSHVLGLQVAGAIFGLVALMQLLRLLTGVEVLVASHSIPLWPNAIAFVIAAGLSFWMFKLSRMTCAT
jgi:hypothetical protein